MHVISRQVSIAKLWHICAASYLRLLTVIGFSGMRMLTRATSQSLFITNRTIRHLKVRKQL